MPPAIPTVKTNTFNMSNQGLLGQLALAINNSRVVSGVLGGATPLQVGSRVKLDSTVTTPGVVRFIAAADNEAAFGTILYSVQEDIVNPGDICEVAFMGAACQVQIASTTLTPGTPVARSSGFLAAVDGTHLQMGLLIDYCTISTPGRVILGWQPV